MSRDAIHLTPVTDDDYELIMAWRSHPEVYRHFSQQTGPLEWNEHYRFWTNRRDRIDWIINYDDGKRPRKVGSINVSSIASQRPEVGIFIGEISLMGRGIGKMALSLVIDWLENEGYNMAYAKISKQNIASQKLFASCGFKKTGEIDETNLIYTIEFGR